MEAYTRIGVAVVQTEYLILSERVHLSMTAMFPTVAAARTTTALLIAVAFPVAVDERGSNQDSFRRMLVHIQAVALLPRGITVDEGDDAYRLDPTMLMIGIGALLLPIS